jgi:hypothetical protein
MVARARERPRRGTVAADAVRVLARSSTVERRRGCVNVLLAPLRPLADVLDLTAEAVAAVGTVSVTALGLLLTRQVETVEQPSQLRVVGDPPPRR